MQVVQLEPAKEHCTPWQDNYAFSCQLFSYSMRIPLRPPPRLPVSLRTRCGSSKFRIKSQDVGLGEAMALIGCADNLYESWKVSFLGEVKISFARMLILGLCGGGDSGPPPCSRPFGLSCSVMTNLMDQTIYNQHSILISALARRTKIELRICGPLHEYSNFFFQIFVHVLQLWPELVHHVWSSHTNGARVDFICWHLHSIWNDISRQQQIRWDFPASSGGPFTGIPNSYGGGKCLEVYINKKLPSNTLFWSPLNHADRNKIPIKHSFYCYSRVW